MHPQMKAKRWEFKGTPQQWLEYLELLNPRLVAPESVTADVERRALHVFLRDDIF